MSQHSFGQDFPGLDKSPADISYFPTRGAERTSRVIYSRPQKKGRKVFGSLVPFGKVWRAGANEATEITFYKDVQVGGQSVSAGSYALFIIPNEQSWTIVLNSALHQWGAYSYDKSKDVVRVDAKVQKAKSTIESFGIKFSGSGDLMIGWDDTYVSVPIK